MSIDKSTLDQLGIHELRDLARQVGVHLPTKFKVEDLKNEIIDILTGVKEPYVKKNNQGRPPKAIKNYTDLTGIFLPKEMGEYLVASATPASVSFNANDVVYANSDENDFVGYLKTYNNFGVVRTKSLDVIFLTRGLISKYSLQNGDYLMGFAKETIDGKKVATDVLKINNVTVKNYVRPEVECLEKKVETVVGNYKITKGGVNLIRTNSSAFDVAKQFSKDNVVVLLNINSKNTTLYSTEDNVNIVNTHFDMSDQDMYEISSLVFDVARNNSTHGKNVVLVVNSLTSLIKAHSTHLTGNFSIDGVKSEAIRETKKLMTYPYLANDASFTIIDIENKEIQRSLDEILKFELHDFYDSVNE